MPEPMTTTAIVVTAICTATPPTIVALASLIQSRRNSKDLNEVADHAKDAATKAETAAGRADELRDTTNKIAIQTNGHLTRLTEDLQRALLQIESLQKTVVTLTNVITAIRTAEAVTDGKTTVAPAVRPEDANIAPPPAESPMPAVREEDIHQAVETLLTIPQARSFEPPKESDRRPKPDKKKEKP